MKASLQSAQPFDHQNAHPSYWFKGGCVASTRYIITLHFASNSLNVWLTFLANNNIRSTPACTVSHWSMCVTNHHLCGSGERNGIQRRIKVIFDRNMMQALELLLRLAKRHVFGWSDIEQWRNQACSYSHCRVILSEGIS